MLCEEKVHTSGDLIPYGSIHTLTRPLIYQPLGLFGENKKYEPDLRIPKNVWSTERRKGPSSPCGSENTLSSRVASFVVRYFNIRTMTSNHSDVSSRPYSTLLTSVNYPERRSRDKGGEGYSERRVQSEEETQGMDGLT